MIIINDTIYIHYADFIHAGWKVDTVKKANLRNGSNWQMIADPNDKRKPLVKFETLTEDHKKRLINRFGNVYEFVVQAPVINMIMPLPEAERYFLGYRYGSKSLPIKRVRQYTRAAQWLTLLNEFSSNISSVKKKFGVNIPTLYKNVASLMEVEKNNGKDDRYEGFDQLPGDFPTSYTRLTQRQASYRKDGYQSLIDKMYGNQLAAKVSSELAEAQLLYYLALPNQYDDVMVCMLYNLWANEKGYKIINPSTVAVWRRKNDSLIITGREGRSAFNEKYIRQVKGYRPSCPLYLVEHDDNNLDLLFSDDNNYAYNKYVSIVVTDSYCDLVLGYSYIHGQQPQDWMVKQAYINAMYYIRSLTGGWYMPFEIKADRWSKKKLYPFYEKIGNHIPPAHGNKHRGYIEQFFASPIWKRCQQLSGDNWSGHNMTAKYRGVNMEALELSKKTRPLVGKGAEEQIELFFNNLRHMPDFKRGNMANAISREQQWLQAWATLNDEQRRPITDEQFLLTFGITHEPKGREIAITNRGIEPQINGVKYSYDLPDGVDMLRVNGAKVNVVYDPYDMSRVLVTNFNDIRFIAHTAQLSPRALQDACIGTRTYLNAILSEKRGQVAAVSNATSQRQSTVDVNYFNAEAVLQGGALEKVIKNRAEHLMISNAAHDEFNPLDLM